MRLPLVTLGTCIAGLSATTARVAGSPERLPQQTREYVFHEGSHLAFDLSPDGQTIAFDLLGQLWLLPASGGDARPLTNALRDTTDDRDPEFAPDGKSILFWSDRADTNGFFRYDTASGTIQPVPIRWEVSQADYPRSWSPDGNQILVSPLTFGQGPPANVLHIVDASDGTAQRIPVEGLPFTSARDASWVRDGSRILFINPESANGTTGRLWEVPRAGGAAKALLPEGVVALAPSSSPDDARVAYYGPDSTGSLQVWILDRATGVRRALTRHTEQLDLADHRFRLRWTPDGRDLISAWGGRLYRIAANGGATREIRFSARVRFTPPARHLGQVAIAAAGAARSAHGFDGLSISPDGERIAVLALDSLREVTLDGRVRVVAPLPAGASGVAWAPDGRRVAWSAGRTGHEDLYVTSLADGTTNRVTALPGGETRAAWSPDGRQLAFAWADTGARPAARLLVTTVLDTPVADRASTRDLGPLQGLNASYLNLVPQWLPDGSALVMQQGSNAVVIPLEGARRRQPLTAGTAFLRTTPDGGLLYTLRNQLRRQPLPADSVTRAPSSLITDEAAIYPSVAASGAVLYVAPDGWVVRDAAGRAHRMGWPVRFSPPVPPALLIRNAYVVDSAGVLPGPRDLLLEGGRIARIAHTATLATPAGTTVIDATGRFVMPGLINAHQHVDVGEDRPARPADRAAVEQLQALLYSGITTIRHPHGRPVAWLAARHDDLDASVLDGPRILFGGLVNPGCFWVDCPQNDVDQYPRGPEEIARSIALLGAFGATHAKLYRPFTVKAAALMVAAAHAQGLRVTGHIAHTLPLLAAGMDGKEHGGQSLDRTLPTMQEDLVTLSRASGIIVTPTIAVAGQVSRVLADSTLRLDPATQFLMRTTSAEQDVAAWIQPANRWWADLWVREWGSRALRLRRAGVPIAAGTDATLPWLTHLELELLVEAGFTPVEAIRAGTIDGARALGVERQLGAAREGYLADLLILDADPTADIRNTRAIRTVISRGRVIDRARLVQ